MQCYNSACLTARGALPDHERKTANHCVHITQAKEALTNNTFATSVMLNLENVLSKVSDEALENAYKQEASDNELCVFVLPGSNLAVPLFGTEKDQYMTDFVHIRNMKCSLDRCMKKSKSKMHALVVKGQPVCRHSLLGLFFRYLYLQHSH